MFRKKPIIVFMGTYPPRECGIASFTKDLLQSSRKFLDKHISCKVAALNHTPLDHHVYPSEVQWEINQENAQEYKAFAETLNNDPLVTGVIVQHEYGIYGGKHGENILEFIEHCKKPILVTLHTVLPKPTPKMKEITSRIIKQSDIIVVLTENSRKILAKVYPFSMGKVYVIPHGIHNTDFSSTEKAKKRLKFTNSTILLTFGLLSRGKGIEYVIQALPEIIKSHPSVLYAIVGETHPAVRRKEGERYRLKLTKLILELGLTDHVKFYDQYLELDDLIEFLKATDIYISTSINPHQAVSGTLSYALGTGRAVISTAFAQAREIITPENGRLVPIKDPQAITVAVQDLLSDQDRLKTMHKNAYDSTRSMLWSNVAKEYSDLMKQLVLPPINVKSLAKMTDEFGLFQFATYDKPNKKFGYTLDDNARALVVCSQLIAQHLNQKGLMGFVTKYLAFIEHCQNADGTFINYIDHGSKEPSVQNTTEDLSEATARAMWALSEVMKNSELPSSVREKAKQLFLLSIAKVKNISYPRPQAFIIKAFVNIGSLLPSVREEIPLLIKQYTKSLADNLHEHSDSTWHWFEDLLAYNNGILCEGLLLGGAYLKNQTYIDLGISSLQFLIDHTFSKNMYIPIGNAHWYYRNGERSYFDQQPEDPASMILALFSAYKLTSYQSYKNLAHQCFSWYLGNNSIHVPLYTYETGGCYDGLEPDRVNLNQGAESLVSYLLARLALTEIDPHED